MSQFLTEFFFIIMGFSRFFLKKTGVRPLKILSEILILKISIFVK